jgi:hypothetical protein
MKILLIKLFRLFGIEIILNPIKPMVNETDYKRLETLGSAGATLKLHFGCGPRVLKGWVNIDLKFEPYEKYLASYTDKYYGPEVRGTQEDFYALDITKTGIPLPDNSVEVVFHEDFLEHLSQKEQYIFLAETFRVLKPGGVHRVNTPNLLSSMKTHTKFGEGIKGVYKEEWDLNGHVCVVTPKYLEDIAANIGYSKVLFSKRDDSISKDIPLEYRPGADRDSEEGNIFADLIK